MDMKLTDIMPAIVRIDTWLDNNVNDAYVAQPLARDIARVAKTGEEAGEAIEAFSRYTGENPRKGMSATIDDVLDEMADVAITGILGIQHFTKDENETVGILIARLAHSLSRIPDGE